MSEALSLITALAAGLLVGLCYFGGLWLTVQKLPLIHYPAPFALSSFVVRIGLMLVIFYFITNGHWGRIALYLLGFFVMRTLLIRRWQPRFSPQRKGER